MIPQRRWGWKDEGLWLSLHKGFIPELACKSSWMNQPVTRDLGVDIRCAAALLCQRAALPINHLVKRDGHCCQLRVQTKVEGSLTRIAASPTCVWPDRIRRKQKSTSSWRSGAQLSCSSLCLANNWVRMPQFVAQRHNILRTAEWEQANRWSRHEGTDNRASYF